MQINLALLPQNSGVYIFKDLTDEILYVGKAKNIAKRVRQYFQDSVNSYKTAKMLEKINSVETIITNTEIEALILERNLIDKYKPFYNVLLLDDKKYPYIFLRLTNNQLEIKIKYFFQKDKNGLYYGPFPIGYGISHVLRFLERECFFENGLPINRKTKDKKYWEQKFEFCKLILESNQAYIKFLEKQMQAYSTKLQYELANDCKKVIDFLISNKERQLFDIKSDKNFYVIALKEISGYLNFCIETYNFGVFLDKQNFLIEIKVNKEEALRQFLNQFFQKKKKPNFIISNIKKSDFSLYFKTEIINPIKGKNKAILDNAIANVENLDESEILKIKAREKNIQQALKYLKQKANAKSASNIMMVDNSNENNFLPISVFIFYKNGYKYPRNYRKYKIEENLKGDTNYLKIGLKKYFKNELNTIPDILILDGGIQQFNIAQKFFYENNIKAKIIALVKNNKHKTEKIIDYKKRVFKIGDQSVLNFLTKIQIEVDAYAKAGFRRRKLGTSLEGKLSQISGIGLKLESKILEHFKTYAAVYNASYEELNKVVPKNIAKKIKKEFKL